MGMITGYNALTGANSATGDLFLVVDVSDTTMGAGGTDKKMTRAELAIAIANAFTLGNTALNIGSGALTAGAISSSVTSGADNLLSINTDGAFKSGVQFKSNGAGPYTKIYFDNATNDSVLDHSLASGSHITKINSVDVETISSTGVAVAGTLSATGNTTTNGNAIVASANASTWTRGQASELLTLSTSGTTTDTSANLLPANSIIESVVARVTTEITTATDWKLGDPTTAGRFTAANSTLTAGTTDVGLVHIDQSGAAGPRQTAAAKVRVTTTGTPGAGAIRITVFYRTLVAPTS